MEVLGHRSGTDVRDFTITLSYDKPMLHIIWGHTGAASARTHTAKAISRIIRALQTQGAPALGCLSSSRRGLIVRLHPPIESFLRPVCT